MRKQSVGVWMFVQQKLYAGAAVFLPVESGGGRNRQDRYKKTHRDNYESPFFSHADSPFFALKTR